jgi:hypothetical protein
MDYDYRNRFLQPHEGRLPPSPASSARASPSSASRRRGASSPACAAVTCPRAFTGSRTGLPDRKRDISTQDVLNRFITALGGTLKLIADFGDEQLKIA